MISCFNLCSRLPSPSPKSKRSSVSWRSAWSTPLTKNLVILILFVAALTKRASPGHFIFVFYGDSFEIFVVIWEQASSFKYNWSHTLLRSVMVRTIHPTPATSVSCARKSVLIKILSRRSRRTFSCQPSKTLPLTSPHPGIAIPL